MRKIGVYGGTFDPIHHGHLILAREALEKLQLTKVIFVPTSVSPHKKSTAASGDMRLTMIRAAIASENKFEVDDCEVRRGPPSYTIDTIREIRTRESEAEFYLLFGQDNVAELPGWHHFNELEKMVRFVVLDRTGATTKHEYEIVCRKIDISGTEIRKRVASGQSIRYLVPAAVEEIITRKNIYREKEK